MANISGRVGGVIRSATPRIDTSRTGSSVFGGANAIRNNTQMPATTSSQGGMQQLTAESQTVIRGLNNYQRMQNPTDVLQTASTSQTPHFYAAELANQSASSSQGFDQNALTGIEQGASFITGRDQHAEAKALVASIGDSATAAKALETLNRSPMGTDVGFRNLVFKEAFKQIDRNFQNAIQAQRALEGRSNQSPQAKNAAAALIHMKRAEGALRVFANDLKKDTGAVLRASLTGMDNPSEAPRPLAKAIVDLIGDTKSMNRQLNLLTSYKQTLHKDDAKALDKRIKIETRKQSMQMAKEMFSINRQLKQEGNAQLSTELRLKRAELKADALRLLEFSKEANKILKS